MSKGHHILPTTNRCFISSAGRTKSVQEFKSKLFEFLLYCRLQSSENHMAIYSSFHRA